MGLHGYPHIDYGRMSYAAQYDDTARELEKFREIDISGRGFGGLFLRFNEEPQEQLQ